MNATDKMFGVMANWKQQLGDGFMRVWHRNWRKASLGGDLTHVDLKRACGGAACSEFVWYAPQGDDRQDQPSWHFRWWRFAAAAMLLASRLK